MVLVTSWSLCVQGTTVTRSPLNPWIDHLDRNTAIYSIFQNMSRRASKTSSRWNKRHLVRDSMPEKILRLLDLCWPHRCTSDPERDETQTKWSKASSTSPTITQHVFPADVRCIYIKLKLLQSWMPFYWERKIISHKGVFIHLQESPSSDRWTSLLS